MPKFLLLLLLCTFPSLSPAQQTDHLTEAVWTILNKMPELTGSDSSENWKSSCRLLNQGVLLIERQSALGVSIHQVSLDTLSVEKISPVVLAPGPRGYYLFIIGQSIPFYGVDSLKLNTLREAFLRLVQARENHYPDHWNPEKTAAAEFVLDVLNRHFALPYQNYDWYFSPLPESVEEISGSGEKVYFLLQWTIQNDSFVLRAVNGYVNREYKCEFHSYRLSIAVKDLVNAQAFLENQLAFQLSGNYANTSSIHTAFNGGCRPGQWSSIQYRHRMALPLSGDSTMLCSKSEAEPELLQQLRAQIALLRE